MTDINSLWIDYQKNRNDDLRTKIIEHYIPLVKIVAS